ncbi:hypothetical protein KIPB_005720 [Kipferlia bialata]|uniref:Uncharacterized protein n=1 Tax=Kipferlia bialata TaxID=797122 RepID=A0A9K3CXQ8_9EUKA|nr:hypothetical protein KIPB_005720 [Kipferlia bialata]|eukprot:g5720.t1
MPESYDGVLRDPEFRDRRDQGVNASRGAAKGGPNKSDQSGDPFANLLEACGGPSPGTADSTAAAKALQSCVLTYIRQTTRSMERMVYNPKGAGARSKASVKNKPVHKIMKPHVPFLVIDRPRSLESCLMSAARAEQAATQKNIGDHQPGSKGKRKR